MIGPARVLALLAMTSAVFGCAAGPKAGVAPRGAAQPAEVVAQSLADADAAAAAGDLPALARALRIVDAAGARPLDGADLDPLPAWRARAGAGAPPMRGSPLGPGYRRGRLPPGQSTRIEQLFLSGERARIAVSTPDGGPLALQVRDARDDAVCNRVGSPSECNWVPVFTGRYSIEIVNQGPAPARYYLVVE